MSSIIRSNHVPGVHSTEVEVAWEIDNDTQDAVVDDTIPELPGGLFLLDEYQESIIALQPPLLLESRSGTFGEMVRLHSGSYSNFAIHPRSL